MDHVKAFVEGGSPPGLAKIPLRTVYDRRVLVPTYYDERFNSAIESLLKTIGCKGVTIGELEDEGLISVTGGHGSPPNDQRNGTIPYIKVSDIRALRVNVNPTNLVTEVIAEQLWGGDCSGLRAWDLVTPNRASSNIGEFSILLPGEERVVLTKEVFVIRVENHQVIDPFYLLWAFSLKAVREQWRRIALMQTNREDCGSRYREIVIPQPKSNEWAEKVSRGFREYFEALDDARGAFVVNTRNDGFEYVANISAVGKLASTEGGTKES
jgi:type I restriction enzyme M protein